MTKNVSKRYALVGGGSGGHITPLIAIAEQLKAKDPDCIVVHIGHKNDHLNDVTRKSRYIDKVFEVSAGKFRRYHGESFVSHLLDFKTILFNIRDFFLFIIGIVQSWWLLGKIKPDNMMMKGGYVCVPVGIGATMRNFRFFTHDSDVTAGLANRIIARWAYLKTHGMPLTKEQQKIDKNVFTGTPLQKSFNSAEIGVTKSMYKDMLGYKGKFVILVVGGGLGARNVNKAFVASVKALIEKDTTVRIVHITGKKLYDETVKDYEAVLSKAMLKKHVLLLDFTSELYKYSGASDIVVTRAGATNLAEFALQAKACVVVPNPVLTGGQQSENAKIFLQRNAIVVVEESALDSGALQNAILDLHKDKEKRIQLEKDIYSLARPDAASDIATILLGAVDEEK